MKRTRQTLSPLFHLGEIGVLVNNSRILLSLSLQELSHKKSYTDCSMMHQKVSALKQDIQLLKVTTDGNEQDSAAAFIK